MNQEKRLDRRSKLIKFLICLLILALVLAGLWFGLKWLDEKDIVESQIGDHGDWGKVAEPEETLLLLDDEGWVYTDEVKTYLLIGTDATNKGSDGPRGEMADFLMLFVINRTQNSFGFIQLNRDILMDVPVLDENGEMTGTYPEQLCTAHWYGRTEEERSANTVKAVSMLLGDLPIDGVYSINMDDIGAINSAIGGVEIEMTEDLTKVDKEFTKGAKVLLTDDQAEKYVRARMEVGEGTNVERMDRQLNYMEAAYNRVVHQLREQPAYINTLYQELEDRIYTDQSGDSLNEFTEYITKGENRGFLRFDGEAREGDTLKDGVKHTEFILKEGTLKETLGKLIELKEESDTTILND